MISSNTDYIMLQIEALGVFLRSLSSTVAKGDDDSAKKSYAEFNAYIKSAQIDDVNFDLFNEKNSQVDIFLKMHEIVSLYGDYAQDKKVLEFKKRIEEKIEENDISVFSFESN